MPFQPSGASTSLDRSTFVNSSPTLQYIAPARVMLPDAMPLNYLDESLRFVVGPKSHCPVLGSEPGPNPLAAAGAAAAVSFTHAIDETSSSNYSVPLYLDAHSHALRARYDKACVRLAGAAGSKSVSGAAYRRQEQLKAGPMAYYPGRDKWLREWQRERMYALAKPQVHDGYGQFLTGDKNAQWLECDEKRRATLLIHEKANMK